MRTLHHRQYSFRQRLGIEQAVCKAVEVYWKMSLRHRLVAVLSVDILGACDYRIWQYRSTQLAP